jgi:hypothetical protein
LMHDWVAQMAGSSLAKTPRNELILDLCGQHDAATIATTVYRQLGAYLTPNAVNLVIDRAKKAGDARALARPSRRGRRSSSPWVRKPARKPRAASAPQPVITERPEVDFLPAPAPLPATAVKLLNAFNNQCRFPLRGSGIGLIVCGAAVAPKSSYCPDCRVRTIFREEGGRTPAVAVSSRDRTKPHDIRPAACAPAREQRPLAPAVTKPRRARRSSGPRVGLDGVDLSGLPPLPVRHRGGARTRVRRVLIRVGSPTCFDPGQLDLFAGDASRTAH